MIKSSSRDTDTLKLQIQIDMLIYKIAEMKTSQNLYLEQNNKLNEQVQELLQTTMNKIPDMFQNMKSKTQEEQKKLIEISQFNSQAKEAIKADQEHQTQAASKKVNYDELVKQKKEQPITLSSEEESKLEKFLIKEIENIDKQINIVKKDKENILKKKNQQGTIKSALDLETELLTIDNNIKQLQQEIKTLQEQTRQTTKQMQNKEQSDEKDLSQLYLVKDKISQYQTKIQKLDGQNKNDLKQFNKNEEFIKKIQTKCTEKKIEYKNIIEKYEEKKKKYFENQKLLLLSQSKDDLLDNKKNAAKAQPGQQQPSTANTGKPGVNQPQQQQPQQQQPEDEAAKAVRKLKRLQTKSYQEIIDKKDKFNELKINKENFKILLHYQQIYEKVLDLNQKTHIKEKLNLENKIMQSEFDAREFTNKIKEKEKEKQMAENRQEELKKVIRFKQLQPLQTTPEQVAIIKALTDTGVRNSRRIIKGAQPNEKMILSDDQDVLEKISINQKIEKITFYFNGNKIYGYFVEYKANGQEKEGLRNVNYAIACNLQKKVFTIESDDKIVSCRGQILNETICFLQFQTDNGINCEIGKEQQNGSNFDFQLEAGEEVLSFFGGIDITPLSESPNDLLLCFLGLEVGKRLIKVQDQIKL